MIEYLVVVNRTASWHSPESRTGGWDVGRGVAMPLGLPIRAGLNNAA